MCGICGMVEAGPVDPDLLRRMNDTLRHRGPDDEGMFVDGHVGLASRRLAIIDLVQGHMPIANEDETIWVVFNGEIYNFQELRADLEKRGHTFRSHTDTEVLVHLYEEHGRDLFGHLRGMFAVALWDATRRTLLLGRDRLGKKPLYYLHDGASLRFASEIKALRVHPATRTTLDLQALNAYFSHLYVPDPLTIHRELRKLPPGHWLEMRDGRVATGAYWDLEPRPAAATTNGGAPRDLEGWTDALENRLEDAVRVRLVSDVPLGAFLSGGIDSATVVGLMSRILDEPVKTFSIGFDEETFDELHYARLAARAFGTQHHEEILRPQAADLIERIVDQFDEPFADASALPTWLVSEVARRHVTVVLSGDGGDEALAGYTAHQVHLRDERFHRRVPAPLRTMARLALGAGASWTRHPRIERIAAAVARADRPLAERYAHILDKRTRRRLFARDTLARMGSLREEETFARYTAAKAFPDFLSRILYVDTKTYLPGDILVKVDRMSMAHSLEVRSPFVDHVLLEWLAGVPSHLKLHGGTSKFLLRQVAARFVPREILERPKKGFGVPIAAWFRGSLREFLHDHLRSTADDGHRLFNAGFVDHMLTEHDQGRRDWSAALWALLVFRIWYRKYG